MENLENIQANALPHMKKSDARKTVEGYKKQLRDKTKDPAKIESDIERFNNLFKDMRRRK